jgi:hypothetical protein
MGLNVTVALIVNLLADESLLKLFAKQPPMNKRIIQFRAM